MGKSSRKLTEDQVHSIIKDILNGETSVAVARRYTISPTQINAIMHLRNWHHLAHTEDTIIEWEQWLRMPKAQRIWSPDKWEKVINNFNKKVKVKVKVKVANG